MILAHPGKLIIIGFFLVLFGFVMPFMMTLRIIQPSFLWSFLSHGASISGLVIGMIGAAVYTGRRRN